MGAISDVAQESVIDKIERISDLELMLKWLDVQGIAGYVYDNFERVSTPFWETDLWSEEVYVAVSMMMQQEFVTPWLEALQSQIDLLYGSKLGVYGAFWNFMEAELGFIYNETYSTYTWATFGWKNQVDRRIIDLENAEDSLTRDQLDKLFFIVDNFDHLKALIEGDISFIIQSVLDEVRPEITQAINTAVAPFEQRLDDIEAGFMGLDTWFIDSLIDIWAFILGGSIIPIEQIEGAMITIGEWFIDEIFKITDPMDAMLFDIMEWISTHQMESGEGIREIVIEEIGKIDTLTIGQLEQVTELIAAATIGGNGAKGEKGDPGVPGEKGERGEPGLPGEPGGIGEVDIYEINRDLYDLLYYQDIVVATGVTEVIDWMIDTFSRKFVEVGEQIAPITEFLTDDTKTALTELVDKFDTPEAIINFLIPDSEGQETEVLELMQILITMTFERGILP